MAAEPSGVTEEDFKVPKLLYCALTQNYQVHSYLLENILLQLCLQNMCWGTSHLPMPL